MTAAMLRALLEALAADLAAELTTLPTATEAGRVFSTKNEAQLRAAVTALQALLAQVALPPDVGAPVPGAAPVPAMVPAMVAQQQSYFAEGTTIAQEAALAVSEAAVKDGKALLRIITPGWGSSGYYSPGVLERDAPAAFPRGTKMYWDHPAAGDTRPERSLRDLAAELTEDARWMGSGPEGPGVYSRARVFAQYQPAVEELAPHIGVSIRASAMMRPGEAEGRKGPLVDRLIPSPTNSVDFVTIPGRGGRIASLFEAARGRNDAQALEVDDVSAEELKAAQEALAASNAERDRALVGLAMVRAATVCAEAIAKVGLPDVSRARLVEALTANPPMKEGALDEAAMAEAATKAASEEKAYLASILGTGTVRGMGSGSAAEGGADAGPDMADSFQRLGLSESAAKTAAAGRRN